jgi:purine-binding chemotaxis protein CheW
MRRESPGQMKDGELYGLIADKIGDVLWLRASSYDANPPNLDPRWAQVCSGVYRLDGKLRKSA